MREALEQLLQIRIRGYDRAFSYSDELIRVLLEQLTIVSSPEFLLALRSLPVLPSLIQSWSVDYHDRTPPALALEIHDPSGLPGPSAAL